MKFLVMEDPVLLKHAQAIFGEDLVKRAYICKCWYSGNPNETKELQDNLFTDDQMRKGDTGQYLSCDYGTDIIVEFSNGRLVEFSVTELLMIEHVTDPENYNIVNGDQIVPFVQS